MKIQDGSGGGYEMGVDSSNRALTRAITEGEAFEALGKGDHYAVTSGAITLTNTSANAMLYFQNDEDKDILIDRIIVNTDDSTGGTDDQFILTLYKNPDGLTSGAGTDVTQVNTNFGSSNTLNLISEKGAAGATVSGGAAVGTWRIENPTRHRVINVRLLLPKGSSIAIAYTPPASNTSMVAICAMNVHLASL